MTLVTKDYGFQEAEKDPTPKSFPETVKQEIDNSLLEYADTTAESVLIDTVGKIETEDEDTLTSTVKKVSMIEKKEEHLQTSFSTREEIIEKEEDSGDKDTMTSTEIIEEESSIEEVPEESDTESVEDEVSGNSPKSEFPLNLPDIPSSKKFQITK